MQFVVFTDSAKCIKRFARVMLVREVIGTPQQHLLLTHLQRANGQKFSEIPGSGTVLFKCAPILFWAYIISATGAICLPCVPQ